MLFGRQLWLPNPLLPHRPLFRIHWTPTDARPEAEDLEALGIFLRDLRPLALPVQGMLWLLIGLPLELGCFGAGLGLLILFAAFYLLIAVSLGYIYHRRESLGLSRRGFLALSLDVLACAPFAVNLVRKLSLRRALAGQPSPVRPPSILGTGIRPADRRALPTARARAASRGGGHAALGGARAAGSSAAPTAAVLARDLAVIFLGLVAGYWTVSKLQDWLAKRARDSGPAIGPSDPAAAPPPSPGDSPWFVVLGVPENAPVDAIVAAYKRKISEYHPDKVARMGAEIRELANCARSRSTRPMRPP